MEKLDNDAEIFYKFYMKAIKLSVPRGVTVKNSDTKFSNRMLKYIFATVLDSKAIANDVIRDSSFDNFSDNDIMDLTSDLRTDNNIDISKARIQSLLSNGSRVHHSLKDIITNDDINTMDDFNNKRLGDYQKIINDINAYVSIQWDKYTNGKTIKTLKHDRNWIIAFAILIPCLIMTIAVPFFNYINGGLMYTAMAFYMHFFNIDMIDRVVLMLICDSPLFVHIHTIDTKIDKIADKY